MELALIGQIATIFELCISSCAFVLAALVLAKYRQKGNKNILNLFAVFLFSSLGIFCSFVARLLVYYLEYTGDENYLVALFVRDHLALVFIVLALLFLQVFSREIVGTREDRVKNITFTAVGVAIAAFLFWAPVDPDDPVHTIAFVLVAIYCLAVCIPLIRVSRRARVKVTDPVYRAGFTALILMAVCYLAVLVCFAVDQAFMLALAWQFNPFYWAGWIVALLAVFFGYLGFILPKWFKNRLTRGATAVVSA